jgi:hypothetical protein
MGKKRDEPRKEGTQETRKTNKGKNTELVCSTQQHQGGGGEVKKLGSIQGVLPSGGRVGVAQEIGRGGGATVRNYTASRTSMNITRWMPTVLLCPIQHVQNYENYCLREVRASSQDVRQQSASHEGGTLQRVKSLRTHINRAEEHTA